MKWYPVTTKVRMTLHHRQHKQMQMQMQSNKKSGNKRKRPVPIQSFDDRFNDLMAFKAKYGHCDVPQRGENASIGKWCKNTRASYKKIQNNQNRSQK
jgi:hypothetical protein